MLERRALGWLAAGLLAGVVGGALAGLLRAPARPAAVARTRPAP